MFVKWGVRKPVLKITACAFALYAAVIPLTDVRDLIVFGNALVTSLAVGVVVTYAPIVFDMLRKDNPQPSEVLAFGIFMGWAGTAIGKTLSLMRYTTGNAHFYGTEVTNIGSVCLFVAGVCHIVAPQVGNGIALRRAWIVSGLWAAAATGATVLWLANR
jgi:hypothetical protein